MRSCGENMIKFKHESVLKANGLTWNVQHEYAPIPASSQSANQTKPNQTVPKNQPDQNLDNNQVLS